MNLSQLQFAAAVAAHGSFTAAAAQCCVTQPTLSNGIAQLESELGGRLFLRTTRKVSMTPFGAHVLPSIAQILAAQANLLHQASAYLRPDRRLIRIGMSPLINARLLGLMLEPFRMQNPGVDVILREMNMQDLERMLQGAQLDFVFGVAGTAGKTRRVSAPLYREPLRFVCRAGAAVSQRGRGRAVQLPDIAAETYVMVPDACGLARTTRALFRRHRRKLHEYSGEAMSYQVLEEWAALGIGAAILPRSKVTSLSSRDLPIVDRRGEEVTIGYEATWPQSGERAAHLLRFADHLRKVVPGIVQGLQEGADGR